MGDKGVAGLFIGSSDDQALEAALGKGFSPVEDEGPFKTLFRELDVYFKGRHVRFSVPADLSGTAFEIKVWKAIASIPWGKTRSYKWIAQRAGVPQGARAAGGACGKNPVPIIIPCHRVLQSGAGLGGYTGGIDIKKRLLALEGVIF